MRLICVCNGWERASKKDTYITAKNAAVPRSDFPPGVCVYVCDKCGTHRPTVSLPLPSPPRQNTVCVCCVVHQIPVVIIGFGRRARTTRCIHCMSCCRFLLRHSGAAPHESKVNGGGGGVRAMSALRVKIDAAFLSKLCACAI